MMLAADAVGAVQLVARLKRVLYTPRGADAPTECPQHLTSSTMTTALVPVINAPYPSST